MCKIHRQTLQGRQQERGTAKVDERKKKKNKKKMTTENTAAHE